MLFTFSGCPIKDAQLDVINSDDGHPQNYPGPLAANEVAGRCVACGHPRSGQENDEENFDRHDNCDKTTTGFEKGNKKLIEHNSVGGDNTNKR